MSLLEVHDTCKVCGGHMVGDGYTSPRHCENVDCPEDRECDAPPLHCEPEPASEPVKPPALELSGEQQSGVRVCVERSRQGLDTVVGGCAGTGKTTMITVLSRTLEGVQVAAYTGKAADVLIRKGVDARTLHGLFYWPSGSGANLHFTLKRHADGTLMEPDFEYLIVDEASMVPEHMFNDIRNELKIPTIYVGDHCQLPPVKGSTNIMTNPDVRLETPHRFAGAIAEFASYIRVGKQPRGFVQTSVCGRSEVILLEPVISWDDKPKMPEGVAEADILLVGSREDGAKMNRTIREQVHGRKSAEPVPGDRIIFLMNNGQIRNGQTATLVSYTGDKAVALLHGLNEEYQFTPYPCLFASDKDVQMVRKAGLGYFDYAYALTVHKAQGSEWPTVAVLDANAGMRWMLESKGTLFRWRYTAATRAQKKLLWVSQ